MHRMTTAAILALTLGATAPAQAQSAQADAEYRRDCTSDYSRLCSDFLPGTPEVAQCFQRRMREVSPRCQATIAKYRQPTRR